MVAALAVMSENCVITKGVSRMQESLDAKMERARRGDQTVAETLALPNGGLGGATVLGKGMSPNELEKMLGKYMHRKVRRSWPTNERGPGVSSNGDLAVAGLKLGNGWASKVIRCASCFSVI